MRPREERRHLAQSMMAGLRVAVLVACVGLAFAAGAASAAIVYSIEPGRVQPLVGGSWTVDLFIAPEGTGETVSGTACLDGDGNEICAWSLHVQASGGVTINDFEPTQPGKVVWNLEASQLRVIGGDPEQGVLTAEKVGTLTLNVVDDGTVSVLGDGASTAVTADLQIESLIETTIAVPEPLVGTGLLVGALSLSAIRSLQTRRRCRMR